MLTNFTRTKEGGSVVTFAVIAVVFAILVIGGVYTVQKSNQPQPSPPKVADSPPPSAAPSKSPQSTPSKAPVQSKSPAPTQQPVKNTPVTGTAPLPKTGPEESFVHIFMLASLVGISVAYVQSHRERFALLGLRNR